MPKDLGSSSGTAAAGRPKARSSAPHYADVAIPVHVPKSFSYRIPEWLRTSAKIGARVIVPLGRNLTTGYIVDLHDSIQADTNLTEAAFKDLVQLLDVDPLLTPEVLQITQWVSDYYGAPWGEVIKAALPPGISAGIEQFLKVTPLGRTRLEALSSKGSSGNSDRALQLTAEVSEIKLGDLVAELGRAQAAKAVRALLSDGLIEMDQRPGSFFAKPKQQRTVQLLRPYEDLAVRWS